MTDWKDMASAPTGERVKLLTDNGEQKAVWCNATKLWWTEEDTVLFTTRVKGWKPLEEE